MHNIFLSYKFHHDAWKAQAVRSVWLAGGGTAILEVERVRSDGEIKQWIDDALEKAAVTLVLVGPKTAASRWVGYEIGLSKSLGKGLLGIDVGGMARGEDFVSSSPMPMLDGYPMYDWVKDDGERQLTSWVSKAMRRYDPRSELHFAKRPIP